MAVECVLNDCVCLNSYHFVNDKLEMFSIKIAKMLEDSAIDQ